ncbi:MAG TPA: HD domain-containing protein [bacterium]|nr:HD domain-containing protein [bacterium]
MKLKVKYFQDPLYGQIAVADPLLLGLIDSRAVQRLRQIRQLGVSYLTFLGAEHSRFSHSLGAMTLMERALEHLAQEEGLRLSNQGRTLALAGALLHDIGHCAFSHTLEASLIGHHERLTARLLREEPELRRLLGAKAAPLAALLEGKLKGAEAVLIHDLLSSQLDVDRLDYLVRDAHYTGVNSGSVDLGRIIASFTVSRGRLAVKERGLLAVEEYFLARYFMYWKVYYHKTSRAMELLLKAVLARAKALWAAGTLQREGVTPALAELLDLGEKVGVAAFLDHDDNDVMVAIKQWASGPDPALAELAGRFLRRRKMALLWEAATLDQDLSPKSRQKVRAYFDRKRPGGADTWLIEDRLGGAPYDPGEPVMVVGQGGRQELSVRSKIIRDIAGSHLHARYYVPQEDLAAVQALLKRA